MDRLIQILREHCDHWRRVIPLMQSGTITMHENGKDVTAHSITESERLLQETEALIAKIEAERA